VYEDKINLYNEYAKIMADLSTIRDLRLLMAPYLKGHQINVLLIHKKYIYWMKIIVTGYIFVVFVIVISNVLHKFAQLFLFLCMYAKNIERKKKQRNTIENKG
jgi:uncharacterized protein HemY